MSSSKQTLNWFWVETQSFGLSVKTTLNSGPCTPGGKPNDPNDAVMHTAIYSTIFLRPSRASYFFFSPYLAQYSGSRCGPESICLISRCGGLQALICHSHWPLALSHSRKGHISIFFFMAVMRFRVTLPASSPLLPTTAITTDEVEFFFFPPYVYGFSLKIQCFIKININPPLHLAQSPPTYLALPAAGFA